MQTKQKNVAARGSDPAMLRAGDEAPAGTPGTGEHICPVCAGRGKFDGGLCENCAGTGKIIAGIAGG